MLVENKGIDGYRCMKWIRWSLFESWTRQFFLDRCEKFYFQGNRGGEIDVLQPEKSDETLCCYYSPFLSNLE